MYKSAKELISMAKSEGKTLPQLVYENECQMRGIEESDGAVYIELSSYLDVMIDSANKTLQEAIPSISGFTGGSAKKLFKYISSGKSLCGEALLTAASYALSTSEVNASMGLIAACPTAGASGIVPSVLLVAAEKTNAERQQILDALLVTAAIGQLIESNATLSGAEGGCQAECGSAAAMAAGAAVYLFGGTIDQIFHAAAIALQNVMGLVCDPIAGLVEVPCINRNASGAANAMLCADMVLSGISSYVPFDEVVDAMYKVGQSMSIELKETALGGLAATPTGKSIKNKILRAKDTIK